MVGSLRGVNVWKEESVGQIWGTRGSGFLDCMCSEGKCVLENDGKVGWVQIPDSVEFSSK